MKSEKQMVILREEHPSAVCINLAKDPSIKSLIPTLRMSPKLKILEESENYIVFAEVRNNTNAKPKVRFIVKSNYSPKYRYIPFLKHAKAKRSKNFVTQFIQGIGIQAHPIKHADDSENVVNASGIIF